jgi:uncharacterized protein YjbI with pentapeptide repeats
MKEWRSFHESEPHLMGSKHEPLHWDKTGLRAHLTTHARGFRHFSRDLAAKAMAWTRALITRFRFTPPPTRRSRQGLRTISPDLISKARDDTGGQITGIGLTFLGTTAFCLLSLLSPDSALLGGSEKINVPLAGPVSFFGFMLLGPIVLIMLRVYLQIYVEHNERLERLAQRMPVVRAPNLVPLKNPLIQISSGLIFYLLLPLAMLLFAWKAAVFPAWGSGLLCIAVGVTASHIMLPLNKLSRRSKALLSVGAAILAGGVMLDFRPRRHFDLYHANLSGQWLSGDNLSSADLRYANLTRANLTTADLSKADLSNADLSHANMSGATLSGTTMISATLRGATLRGATLRNASLNFANLSNANLSVADLTGAAMISTTLSGADLSSADLNGAKLNGADLTRAKLELTKLHRAILTIADLRDANLFDANLTCADLTGAKNLTQKQLVGACGDPATKLPEGLTVEPCLSRGR